MSTIEEIKAEYTSSLADLTINSKPLINMLTMLAEENLTNSKAIVEAIESHLYKVKTDVKLPILYLIDCIVKNVGKNYTTNFAQNIVQTFCNVFKVVDEKTRAEMFKLRQTWNDVFPQTKLYAIDVKINMLDPAWPVTAKPSSIHFNPKFLKPTASPTTSASSQMTSEAQVPMPASASGTMDKETLLMQEKLIQKQKELLELQQKKLELEVLQTQVKLREQIGVGSNILVKPEVANQIIPGILNNKPSKPMGVAANVMQQRLQNNLAAQTPKITPVSPALATAARPIRDPRLLRQMQTQKASDNNQSNSSAQLGQKTQSTNLENNNKNVSNKLGVKDIRKDPRLSKIPKTLPKSRSTLDTEQPAAKSFKNQARSSKNGTDSDKSSLSSKSSSSSLDSPTKYNKSLNSSPKKVRKNKTNDSSNNTSSISNKNSVNVPTISNNKDVNKRDRLSSVPRRNSPSSFKDLDGPSSNSISNSTFKGVKTLAKNRNYIRRNLSESPEPAKDEDLRPFTVPPEKQPRTQSDFPEVGATTPLPTPNTLSKPMDVDLRQFPAVISKKRSSTEEPDSGPAKKSKSEILDVLFGNEDTDLRQLPVANDRPPTPPPPIISNSDPVTQNATPKGSPKKSVNTDLEAVRAKLANATNKDKFMSKSFHKKKLAAAKAMDQDHRVPKPLSDAESTKNKIFISPDDVKSINSGEMTKEQQTALLNKLFMHFEKTKLREAKEKDEEHMPLQSISDDELDTEESYDDSNKFAPNTDKDERFRLPNMHNMQMDNENHQQQHQVQQFYPRDQRPRFPSMPWRGGPNWRLRGRGQPMNPMLRAPLRPPRMGMPPNWRNIPPNFPPEDDFSSDLQLDRDTKANAAILQREVKTITIDSIPRDIRYYGETAVIFLNWDDPREISFQAGIRRVNFNDKEVYTLGFGDPYKECSVNGVLHKVRLGAPSKEIFIDGVGYECFFGGAAITVELASGEKISVQLEGPNPQVKIGETRRTDLVAAKITLIINAKIIVPVFLDAKTQYFIIDGEKCALRFVDALRTVLINDVPFNVEFGGLPKPFNINNKKHFIRFSVLPKGIKPGHVRIADMEGQVEENMSPRMEETSQDGSDDIVKKPLAVERVGDESPDARSNSPSYFQNLLQPSLNNLNILPNLDTAVSTPPAAGYQLENIPQQQSNTQTTLPQTSSTAAVPPISTLNINELFQKLVASGFVKSEAPQPKPDVKPQPIIPPKPRPEPSQNLAKPPRKNLLETLRPVTFARPETFKIRQGALYAALYAGLQCSSCGMRFSPEASIQYSQHLDWHFRQNRKGKKNIRVASSRRWFYSLSDWKNYEEIEDLEEREKNYFDQQQHAETVSEEGEEETEVPTVPADPESTDQRCEVCRDKFEQFFHEDKEEWHLRNATEVDGKIFHPVCYEDYSQSVLECSISMDESKQEDSQPKEALIPGLEIILDDDDEEDRQTAPSPSSADIVSLEESDESKPPTEAPPPEEMQEDDDDDDVILNEVAPINIIVEDDDDDDEMTGITNNTPVQQVRVKKEKHVDDDGFVDVGEGLVSLNKVGQIKIKSEPMDHDESIVSVPEEPAADEPMSVEPDLSNKVALDISPARSEDLDGNDDLASSVPTTLPSGITSKIKINISKPLAVINKEKETVPVLNDSLPLVSENEPYPPGEEPEVPLKPGLQGVDLKKLPSVRKGAELTGLCSIM